MMLSGANYKQHRQEHMKTTAPCYILLSILSPTVAGQTQRGSLCSHRLPLGNVHRQAMLRRDGDPKPQLNGGIVDELEGVSPVQSGKCDYRLLHCELDPYAHAGPCSVTGNRQTLFKHAIRSMSGSVKPPMY